MVVTIFASVRRTGTAPGPGTMTSSTLPSDIRIGAYQLRERIGEGGFARVYHATGPGGDVALKMLAPIDGTLEDDAVRRFEREIETLARVRHPNLVALLDHGVDPAHGPWLAMPLLVGLTLRDLLPAPQGRQGGRGGRGGLGPEGALRLTLPVVRALGAMHAAGLVHRDLKPENVIVSTRGEVTLVDLGLAIGLEQSRLTQAGAVAGSIPYMAAERIEGEAPLPASDVFSIGVMLYELCCGARPFARERQGEEVAAILAGQHEPLAARDRRVSPALDALVERCLAPRPADRPVDAHELALGLEELLDWAPPSAQRPEVVALLTDPRTYQEARAAERVDTLSAQAARARDAGDTFEALALLDRALAYRPDDPALLAAVEEASAGPSTPPPSSSTPPRAAGPAHPAQPTPRPAEPERRTLGGVPLARGALGRRVDAHARTEHAPTPRPAAPPSPGRGRALALGLGALALALAAGLGGWWLRAPADDAEPPPEPLEATPEAELAAATPDAGPPKTETRLPTSGAPARPLPGLDTLPPIPPGELEGGEVLGMEDNVRQDGEPLVPPRMIGDPQAALARVDAHLAAHPDDHPWKVSRAVAQLALGQEEAGLAGLAELERSHPEVQALWGVLGYVRMRQGRLEEAEAAFDRAIRLDPADATALRNRGILRHRLGRRPEAHADLRRALRYDPNDVNALAELAQIYEQVGRGPEARPLIERIVRLQPRNVQAWVDLSVAQPDPDEALASLERALALAPGYPRALVRRCAVLARAQRAEGVTACTRAMEVAPDDPWVRMHRGLAHYHQGQNEAALVDMDAAIEAIPNDPVMRTNRYLVLQHLGRTDGARNDLQAACAMDHEPACNELRDLGVTP
ncbi:MAG: hypothetical protein CMN29_27655 [Sandaracinus sp.]|nr:hypothetical protein [Myxococcales bacterium]MAT28691.1 hypothetical protein [Sandaracinus sp.]